MTPLDPSAGAIINLAEEIAAAFAGMRRKALKIVDFARELSDFEPDHASIQDAIESEMLDDEYIGHAGSKRGFSTMKPELCIHSPVKE